MSGRRRIQIGPPKIQPLIAKLPLMRAKGASFAGGTGIEWQGPFPSDRVDSRPRWADRTPLLLEVPCADDSFSSSASWQGSWLSGAARARPTATRATGETAAAETAPRAE